jgi:hypothetical protein
MPLKKAISGCLILFGLLGCEDIDKILTFPINDRTTIQIQSTSPLNLPLEVATPAVTSNSQQQYENNNTRADLVKDVTLDQLKLTITDPVSKTFSFVKTIRIYISSDQNNEIELASLDNISSNSNILELVPTEAKLDTYARASSYNLRTEVVTDETLTQDVEVQIDLRFLVTAETY